jgi:hypothetical protein
MDKFGEEGGLKPQFLGMPHFRRENATISFTPTNFRFVHAKCTEVP